ncbi:MAG: Fpg/Nei family DNA glycosylase [Promethearchaeota archaeon]
MPELPEVEIYKRYLDSTSLNKEITDIFVRDERILKIDGNHFKKQVIGKEFLSTMRHGKNLFIKLDSIYILLHFGMSGDLEYFKPLEKEPRYSKVIFQFKNGHYLAYISIRLFGKVDLVENLNEFIEQNKLGPDAYKMTMEEFLFATRRRSGNLKNLLLNQEFIAGIGNVYSDEILFRSGLSPKKKIKDLNENELKTLYEQIKEVIKFGIKKEGDWTSYPGNSLIPHRKKNNICPNCATILDIIEISGRRGFFCPKCQK